MKTDSGLLVMELRCNKGHTWEAALPKFWFDLSEWRCIKCNAPATSAQLDRNFDFKMTFRDAQISGIFEKAVREKGGCQPSWVLECQEALRHRDQNIPWLDALLNALEWQGGTIHNALQCVRRLVNIEKEREQTK